jgi:Na+-translocating ferredoxin:NAD+ oxidoreductase RNF subunit RnfB
LTLKERWMATGKEVYIDIAKKLDAPLSQRFINILEVTFSAEEGKAILELFVPSTCREVAGRLNADEAKVFTVLEDLADRGVINKGETQYAFHSSVMAFHHHVVGGVGVEPTPEKIKKAWGDFFYNEWCDIIVDGYVQRQRATGRPVHRVWPAIGALELSPDIRPEDIMPEENFKLKLQNTKRIIVGHCGCRKNWATCDHPIETCFAPTDGPGAARLLGKPNRTSIREVSLEEALDIVRRNEEAGLVHTGACFCCVDACEILYSLTRAQRFDLLGRSRYQAKVDEDKCTGCQDCVERCPFNAIEMRKPANSKKLKSSIIAEKCMGCGVCVIGCKQRALSYEIVRPPEYVKMPKPKPGAVIGVPCVCLDLK